MFCSSGIHVVTKTALRLRLLVTTVFQKFPYGHGKHFFRYAANNRVSQNTLVIHLYSWNTHDTHISRDFRQVIRAYFDQIYLTDKLFHHTLHYWNT